MSKGRSDAIPEAASAADAATACPDKSGAPLSSTVIHDWTTVVQEGALELEARFFTEHHTTVRREFATLADAWASLKSGK